MLQRLSRRFVAGPGMKHALAIARQDQELGIYGMINRLGEHYHERGPVRETVEEYGELAGEIADRGLDADLSVKPTQLGLMISEELFREELRRLLEVAEENGVFVWLDMESLDELEATLDAYRDLHPDFPQLGVTLQAYLKRTEGDLEDLLDRGAVIRLVKGIYDPDSREKVGDREDVRRSYARLTERLFEAGERFALGTHDEKLLSHALRLAEEHGNEPEFQLLLGVKESLGTRLAASGFGVGEYIPYGRDWWPYFRRRLQEDPRNVPRAVRDFFSYDHRKLARIEGPESGI